MRFDGSQSSVAASFLRLLFRTLQLGSFFYRAKTASAKKRSKAFLTLDAPFDVAAVGTHTHTHGSAVTTHTKTATLA